MTIYLAIYSPSSVQKVVDFVKTVFASGIYVPVLIKPIGAAAQIGVPEAFKIAYKMGKPLVVLPEITDIVGVLRVDKLYYLDEAGEEVLLRAIATETNRDVAIVVPSGEQEPSRKELEKTSVVWPREIPRGLPAVAVSAILIYELLKSHQVT